MVSLVNYNAHPVVTMDLTNGELGYVPTAEAASYGADIDTLKVQANTGARHVDYAIGALNSLVGASN